MLLAIETSCDETALCLANIGPEFSIIYENISSQIDLHREYGGVVPELAARQHNINLPIIFEDAFKNTDINQLSAIAVTRGPGLKGCLLVGLSFCKALAQTLEVPLIPINHLEAHFYSGFLLEQKPQFPILTLLVSGGHTMLFLARSHGSYQLIAQTRDDAAGEAFDKGATLLGLPYPGGPSLSMRADKGDLNSYKFPISMLDDDSSFSFSGLKTALLREVKLKKELTADDIDNLSASYQEAIVNALIKKSLAACKNLKPKSFLLTGGVAANSRLRNRLQEEITKLGTDFYATPPQWCTDNAAMVASNANAIITNESSSYKNWKRTHQKLGPQASCDIGVLSRWPIGES